jgi:hypothetical protein
LIEKISDEIKKLIPISDASSSNEAVHLQQRLKSLSTELVTLRNRLHVGSNASASASLLNNGVVRLFIFLFISCTKVLNNFAIKMKKKSNLKIVG